MHASAPELMKSTAPYRQKERPSWLDEPWARELAEVVVKHHEFGINSTAHTTASKERAVRAARAIADLDRLFHPEARPDLARVEAKLREILAIFDQGAIEILPQHRHKVVLGTLRRTLSMLSRPAWHDEDWALRLLPVLARDWSFTSKSGGKKDAQEANKSLATLKELVSTKIRPNPVQVREILGRIRTPLRNDRIQLADDGGDQTAMMTRGLLESYTLLGNAKV